VVLEGINNVVMLSDFRNDFGNIYGAQMTDGPMRLPSASPLSA